MQQVSTFDTANKPFFYKSQMDPQHAQTNFVCTHVCTRMWCTCMPRCFQVDRVRKTVPEDEDDYDDAENDRLPRNTRKHKRGLVLDAVCEEAPKRKRRSSGQGDNQHPEVVVACAPSKSVPSLKPELVAIGGEQAACRRCITCNASETTKKH